MTVFWRSTITSIQDTNRNQYSLTELSLGMRWYVLAAFIRVGPETMKSSFFNAMNIWLLDQRSVGGSLLCILMIQRLAMVELLWHPVLC